MTHFIFILRILFHHTRTTEGIRTLDSALVEAVVDAYAERQKNSIHETVDTYLSELEGPVENSSEAVVQFISDIIVRKRLYLSINVPASLPQTRWVYAFTENLLTVSQIARKARR